MSFLPGAHSLLGVLSRKDLLEAVTDVDDADSKDEENQLRLKARMWQQDILNSDELITFSDQWVLGLYGERLIDEPHIVDNYEVVEDSLHGKLGQPVMVIKQMLGGNKSPVNVQTFVYLGILTGEEMQVDLVKQTVHMPTNKFCLVKKPFVLPTQNIAMFDKPIQLTTLNPEPTVPKEDLGADLHKPLDVDYSDGQRQISATWQYPALEVVSGLDEIHDWLGRGVEGFERRQKDTDPLLYDRQYLALRDMADHLCIEGFMATNPHLKDIDKVYRASNLI